MTVTISDTGTLQFFDSGSTYGINFLGGSTITQEGGDLVSYGQCFVAGGSTYQLDGGKLTSSGGHNRLFYIGGSVGIAESYFVMNGGEAEFTTAASGVTTSLAVGHLGAGKATVNDGTLTAQGILLGSAITAGYTSSEGNFIQNGGNITVNLSPNGTYGIQMVRGSYTITGGTLDCAKINVLANVGTTVNTLNFHGGSTTVTGSYTTVAGNAVSFKIGDAGFGTLNVAGTVSAAGNYSVDVRNGIALTNHFDSDGMTFMTGPSSLSGMVPLFTVSSLWENPVADGNSLTVAPKASLEFNDTSAPAEAGWMNLGRLPTGEVQLNLQTEGIDNQDIADDFLAFIRNETTSAEPLGLNEYLLTKNVASPNDSWFLWNFSALNTSEGYHILLSDVTIPGNDVPEPATWVLFLLGGTGWILVRRRRHG